MESEINLFNTPITQLTNDKHNQCEGILTEHECTEALNDMSKQKSRI